MKILQLISMTALLATGMLQAAGAVKPYAEEAGSGLRLALQPVIGDVAFVNQLFQDLYNRAPASAELAANVDALKQGTATRAEVAASLFGAAEFHDNAAFLVKCYVALLDRDPDFERWSQILGLMQKGASQDSALAAFMSMPEYAAAYPGTLSDGAFATKVYQAILGRNPENRELDSWETKLAQGRARGEMVEEFLRSSEFEVRISSRINTSLASLVFLRRTAEPAAMSRWADRLNAGASIAELIGEVTSLQVTPAASN